MAPGIGSGFVTWPAASDDRTLGLVELGISRTRTLPDEHACGRGAMGS
jgi:hypothetical protein